MRFVFLRLGKKLILCPMNRMAKFNILQQARRSAYLKLDAMCIHSTCATSNSDLQYKVIFYLLSQLRYKILGINMF
jgi:hypothetical protein